MNDPNVERVGKQMHHAEIGRPALWQSLKRRALGGDQLGATGVVTLADAADKDPIGFEAVEIPAPPAPEPLVEADLDMAVGGLDAAVLIGHAGIVAGGRHAVVPAQLIVALGKIALGVAIKVLESGRQGVGSVLAWDASQLPESVLQAF